MTKLFRSIELLIMLLVVSVVFSINCGEKTGPAPEPTAVPEPTVVVKPCSATGLMAGDKKVYEGDCRVSASCRDGQDRFFYGECQSQ